jgi:hypothetical protein
VNNDPCVDERADRDRAAVALARNQAGSRYAVGRVRYYSALAHTAFHTPPATPDELVWIRGMRDDWFDANDVAARPYPSDQCGLCSTVWMWAGKRAQAAYQQAALQEALDDAQAAFDECLEENADVPDDGGAPDVQPPADDDEALDMIGVATPGFGGSERCLASRVGHGHEGEMCRVRLGADRRCQYHGGGLAAA